MTDKQDKQSAKQAQSFSRKQILESRLFQDRRDLLSALLKEGETYTVKQAETLMDQFLKKEVQ